MWGVSWTNADTVLSISADGTIKQWDSISGQVSRSRPPHTLGLVSLSVDPTGKQALYNTLEGLTCLWDLEDGEVKGSFESYARTAGGESTEPCTCIYLYLVYTFLTALDACLLDFQFISQLISSVFSRSCCLSQHGLYP